jgi:hypothetical protein
MALLDSVVNPDGWRKTTYACCSVVWRSWEEPSELRTPISACREHGGDE